MNVIAISAWRWCVCAVLAAVCWEVCRKQKTAMPFGRRMWWACRKSTYMHPFDWMYHIYIRQYMGLCHPRQHFQPSAGCIIDFFMLVCGYRFQHINCFVFYVFAIFVLVCMHRFQPMTGCFFFFETCFGSVCPRPIISSRCFFFGERPKLSINRFYFHGCSWKQNAVPVLSPSHQGDGSE